MEVIMKTLMAGPAGTRHPGERATVSPKEAAMLIEGGYAEAIGDMPKKLSRAEEKKAQEAAEQLKNELQQDLEVLNGQLAEADDADKPAIQQAIADKQAELDKLA